MNLKKVYSAFVITWDLGIDAIVMLSHKGEKASLTISKKRELKNQKSD